MPRASGSYGRLAGWLAGWLAGRRNVGGVKILYRFNYSDC